MRHLSAAKVSCGAWLGLVVVAAAACGAEHAGSGAAGAGAAGGADAVTSTAAGEGGSAGGDSVMVTALDDGSFVCTPAGSGVAAGVLYNHGGKGTAIGGDLEGTCRALAEAGYLGYSKRRRDTTSLFGHLDDVMEGLNALLAHPRIDSTRVGMMGFSRGGLLTLEAAIDLGDGLHAAVMMAPAPGGQNQIETDLLEADAISAPVLLLVANNDKAQADHVAICAQVEEALQAAGKSVEKIVYPDYGSDGHELFFEVRSSYWSDVLSFLEQHLTR